MLLGATGVARLGVTGVTHLGAGLSGAAAVVFFRAPGVALLGVVGSNLNSQLKPEHYNSPN